MKRKKHNFLFPRAILCFSGGWHDYRIIFLLFDSISWSAKVKDIPEDSSSKLFCFEMSLSRCVRVTNKNWPAKEISPVTIAS